MNCARFAELSDLFLVGEVRPQEAEQMQAHLAVCPDCAGQLALDRAIRDALSRTGDGEVASPALRQRVAASLDGLDAQPAPARRWQRWLAAAVLLLAVGLGIYHNGTIRPDWTPSRDMVHTHQYYLAQKEAPYEVVTPDRGALASWLEARLEQKIALADGSWDVMGARISAVNQHKAGLVFYEDRGARVSYFICPAARISLKGMRQLTIHGKVRWQSLHDGYQVLIWKDGPVWYGLVSDASTGDLSFR